MITVRTYCVAWLTAAAFGLLAGCAGPSTAVGAAGGGGSEDALVVERGELQPRLLLTGELVAGEAERLLVPNTNFWPVSLRWLIEDGAQVRTGDRLAEFDGSQLAGRLESLENTVVNAQIALLGARSNAASELESAQFQLAQQQASYDKAKLEADLPDGLLAEQEMASRRLTYEKATLELEQSRQAVEAAIRAGDESIRLEEIKLGKAERALDRAQRNLEALTLKAPRDGIVLVTLNRREGRPFQTGDNAWPGLAVVTLPNLESLRVEAQLFDVDDGRVRPGQAVTATLDAFPDWQIGGVVHSVDPIADETDRSSTRRRFRVDIALDDVDPARMRPGMSVKVDVRGAPREALLVPRRALDFRGGAPRLQLAGGDAVEVALGECTHRRCEVTSGVEAGARLRAVAR
ncbi:MAG: efflux RND transporter periplasmic adaptor subunit [Acidobacteriota bacterium]